MEHLRNFAIAAVLIMSALAVSGRAGNPKLLRDRDPRFAPNLAELRQGKIQYFYELIGEDGSVFDEDQRANHSGSTSLALSKFATLDERDDRTQGRYSIAIAKIAYLVNRDISTFTQAQACDLKYIRHLSPDLEFKAVEGPCRFKVESTTFSPSAFFEIKWFENAGDRKAPSEYLAFEENFPMMPEKTAFQRNDHFSKVFGKESARSSSTLSNHYSVSPGQTLIIISSISVIKTFPPGIMGGRGSFLGKMKDRLLHTVPRIVTAY